MDLDAQLGPRLREERKRLGLSQQAAADAAGVRREMWAKYEGGAEPGAKALSGMARCGIDIRYLLTGDHEESRTPPAPAQAIDADLFFRIAEKLDSIASTARKRFPERTKMEKVLLIYNYLVDEGNDQADDGRIERTLRLVVNQ